MGVGYSADKSKVDSRAGYLIVSLNENFRGIESFWQFLNSPAGTPEKLVAMGYSPEEAQLLYDTFSALAKLGRVSKGADTVPAVSNFFYHAQNLAPLEIS